MYMCACVCIYIHVRSALETETLNEFVCEGRVIGVQPTHADYFFAEDDDAVDRGTRTRPSS